MEKRSAQLGGNVLETMSTRQVPLPRHFENGAAEDGQNPVQRFRHSRLPAATKHIRLLSVRGHEVAGFLLLDCTLTTLRFEPHLRYHAISYTWGPQDQTENIVLDGKMHTVRKNCADVLRQLCHFKTAEYYWIDTLCIDQEKLEEKRRQVAMMGKIYRQAEHVLMCIGPKDGEDEDALRLLCEYDEYRDASGPFEKPRDETHRSALLFTQHRIFLSWTRHHAGEEILSLWLLCLRLARREYFKRVWIISEFLLAQSAKFYLGDVCISWESLHDVLRYLDYGQGVFHSSIMCVFDTNIPTERSVHIEITDADRAIIEREVEPMEGREAVKLLDERWRQLKTTRRNPPEYYLLGEVLRLVRHRLCQDRRDKVYSMLPLMTYEERRALKPDYNITPFQLAASVLEECEMYTSLEAAMLVIALQVHPHTPEVQEGVQRRRHASSAEGTAVTLEASSLGSNHCVKASQYVQLGHDSQWRLGVPTSDGSLKTVVSASTGDKIGKAFAGARDGDWILKLSFNRSAWIALPNIVLRLIDEVYIIVGLAEIGEAWYHLPPQDGMEHFDLFFSSIDLLVFLASMNFDPEIYGEDGLEIAPLSTRLNVNVPGAPFSSFAIRNRNLSSSPSMFLYKPLPVALRWTDLEDEDRLRNA